MTRSDTVDTSTSSTTDTQPSVASSEQTDNQSSSEPAPPLSPDVASKVKKQVEFYFSDSNYPTDKFLLTTAKEDPEGFVPISVLTKFNRMKSLTTNVEQIAQCLVGSDEIILNEDKTKIKRKTPIPENLDTTQRTVFVENVPTTAELEELQEFFSKYGDVKSVRILRNKGKNPTGRVYVEFSTEQQAEELIKQININYQDQVLTVSKKIQSNLLGKKRSKPDPKSKNSKDEEKSEDDKPKFQSGSVVRVTGVPEDTNPLTLKKFFENAVFVEKPEGLPEFLVRFKSADDAKAAQEKKEEFEGNQITISPLTEKEEEQFRESFAKAMKGKGRKGPKGKKRPRY